MLIVFILGAIAFFSVKRNRELKENIKERDKEISALTNEISSLKKYIESTEKMKKEVSNAKNKISSTADSATAGVVNDVMQNIPRRKK
jgi:uncharacterized protein YaaN involved in tellurite resistance